MEANKRSPSLRPRKCSAYAYLALRVDFVSIHTNFMECIEGEKMAVEPEVEVEIEAITSPNPRAATPTPSPISTGEASGAEPQISTGEASGVEQFAPVPPAKAARSPRAGKPNMQKKSSFLMATASSSVKSRGVSKLQGGAFPFSASVPSISETKTQHNAHVVQRGPPRPASAKPPSLTVPFSPKFRSDARSKNNARPVPLTTEEREAAKIAEERRQVVDRMLKNRVRMEKVKVLAANAKESAATVRSTKELTVPTTPTFLLSKKNGPKLMSNAANADNKADEAPKPARKSVWEDGIKRPTQFEPFKFATDARASSHGAAVLKSFNNAIIPSAEIAHNFLRDARQYDAPKANTCKSITQPQAPVFHTDARLLARPKPLSREELEEAAMEEALKHTFKAKPVDRRVFESMGEMGVPKVASKASTACVEFHLRTEARGAAAARNEGEGDRGVAASAFKARPMPSFAQPAMCATPSSQFKPTIAISPRFIKTHASTAPARRQKPHHADVEKNKNLILAQSRTIKPPVLTEPTPFRLQSSVRHEDSVAQFNEIIKQVEAKMIEVGAFHAKPAPRTTYEAPQTPMPEHRAPLIPLSVTLESDLRAAKRAEFDAKNAHHMKEVSLKKEADKRNKEEQENLEIKKLRRMSVQEGGYNVAATPVVTKDLYPTPRPASVAATMPKSPFLLTKQRALMGQQLDAPASDRKTLEMTGALASM